MDGQWRSGAVLAAVAALGAAGAHLSLRASSDGTTSSCALLAGVLLLSLALWPVAARAGTVRSSAAVLAIAQFGSHALGVLTAGQAHSASALVCCPSTSQVRPGPIGALTAHAGWTLVAAQLSACLLLAIALRTARCGADLVSQSLRLARELVGAGRRRFRAALILLRALTVPTLPPCPPTPRPQTRLRRPQRHTTGSVTRRGPPATARLLVHAAG